jgi:hypothetical protein
VAGRGDRDQLGDRVDAVRRAVARMVGKRRSQNSPRPRWPGVEPHVRVTGLVIRRVIALATTSRGREVGQLVHAPA